MFDLRRFLWILLFDTQAWPERSYERESVFPSVHASYSLSSHLSISSLRIGLFVFLKLSMVLGAHI